MEIESFEPYHIGIKLRSKLTEGVGGISQKLRNVFKNAGYEILPEPSFQTGVIIGTLAEDIAKKDGMKIQINYDANAINTIGEDPKKVIEGFESLLKLLGELGYDTAASILFYEILSTMTIKTNANPLEVLGSATKISTEDFSDLDASVTGIKISTKEIKSTGELFELIIEPKITSPKNRYHVKFLCRSPDVEKIRDFNSSLKSRIQKIIKSLEKG